MSHTLINKQILNCPVYTIFIRCLGNQGTYYGNKGTYYGNKDTYYGNKGTYYGNKGTYYGHKCEYIMLEIIAMVTSHLIICHHQHFDVTFPRHGTFVTRVSGVTMVMVTCVAMVTMR